MPLEWLHHLISCAHEEEACEQGVLESLQECWRHKVKSLHSSKVLVRKILIERALSEVLCQAADGRVVLSRS